MRDQLAYFYERESVFRMLRLIPQCLKPGCPMQSTTSTVNDNNSLGTVGEAFM